VLVPRRIQPYVPARLSLLALALATLAAACGGGATSAPATETREGSRSERAPAVEPKEERPQAPDISGPTIDGGAASLADFRGKPVFIKAFASW